MFAAMYNSTFRSPVRWSLSSSAQCAALIGSLVFGSPRSWGQMPPPAAAKHGAAESVAPTGGFSGKVLETMNAASYTYALVDTSSGKRWTAAPQVAVKVGDTVAVADAMAMPNYHSKTLNRDFEVVYFAAGLTVNGAAPAASAMPSLPTNHPPITSAVAKPAMQITGIKKADGGKTVAEIFAGQAKLKGQAVKVRGRVVKYNANIMGKNWLHIQDGTGAAGSNDLTITTATAAKVGDTVLVTGAVVTDRDFGGGYKYGVIIEDAKVTVE